MQKLYRSSEKRVIMGCKWDDGQLGIVENWHFEKCETEREEKRGALLSRAVLPLALNSSSEANWPPSESRPFAQIGVNLKVKRTPAAALLTLGCAGQFREVPARHDVALRGPPLFALHLVPLFFPSSAKSWINGSFMKTMVLGLFFVHWKKCVHKMKITKNLHLENLCHEIVLVYVHIYV